MPDRPGAKATLLRLTPLVGMGLLGYLLSTVRLNAIKANAKTVGWGLLVVIALAGLSHVIKTSAWRLTLRHEACKVTFARTLGLRLISEAIGQFGFIGMLGGEAARVSLLGSGVSAAGAISSVALDRSLSIIAGAVVTISGLVGLLVVASISHAVQYYAFALMTGILLMLVAGILAIRRRWPVLSGVARMVARIPWCRKWIAGREATLESAEQRLLDFYSEAPQAFWSSAVLNLICHALAIVEVYLIVRMIGAPATLLGALVLESLTKLINVVGSVNPGNVGTYEGGNMVIGRLVQLTATQGLVLALCRRLRAVFWAIIGGLCLLWLSRRRRSTGSTVRSGIDRNTADTSGNESRSNLCECVAAVILAHDPPFSGEFEPARAKVATLPVVLRAVLGTQGKSIARTIVVLNTRSGNGVRSDLVLSGRIPPGAEWVSVPAGTTLPEILRLSGVEAERIELVRGSFSYRPNLFRMLREWNGEGGALEILSSGRPTGLVALTRDMAKKLAAERDAEIITDLDLHDWIAEQRCAPSPDTVPYIEVDGGQWQPIRRPEDLKAAEGKLDQWLVKPTDGIFARMNRRVSIPISRWAINLPVTPNMISLFTLALSLVAAGFFALGGYWNCVMGALLGVLGSILDGCDGEVARLKLQASAFGCWLDTICDYTYYIVTFTGIIVGVTRSTGDPKTMGWGIAIFAGAVLTFTLSSIGRSRLSGDSPEQYLQVWQKEAAAQKSSLLLRVARQTEFIVRRCFLPYLLLALALMNLMPVLVYMAAFGANVAWIVALRSVMVFPGKLRGSSSARRPLIVKA